MTARNTLIEKLDRLLAERLGDFTSGLMPSEVADRVLGYVVSSDFVDQEHIERQRQLRAMLRDLLDEGSISSEEHNRIGPIITMTPAEADLGDDAV